MRRADVDPADVPPRSETLARMDRAVLYCFLAVRAVHLLQGVICVASGRNAYRRRTRATAVLAGAAIESAWLARRGLRRGALDARIATVDACLGVAGLNALASCLAPEDQTASMNWMLPYTVGGSLAIGVALPARVGVTVTSGMAGAYLVSVRDSFRGSEASSVVAVANAASYLGFYGVSRLVMSFLEHNGTQLEIARRQAIERGERLATERERNRQHRVLHDDALQVLEAIGRGWLQPEDAQSQASAAAQSLRRALRGDDLFPADATLAAMLEDLAAEFTARGLTLELVFGPMARDPERAAQIALVEAAREALNNVLKHSGSHHAVVHVGDNAGRATVTIRDHGKGFDPLSTATGFGLPESVAARMLEVGGTADIWSQPGRGTRVEISAPA